MSNKNSGLKFWKARGCPVPRMAPKRIRNQRGPPAAQHVAAPNKRSAQHVLVGNPLAKPSRKVSGHASDLAHSMMKNNVPVTQILKIIQDHNGSVKSQSGRVACEHDYRQFSQLQTPHGPVSTHVSMPLKTGKRLKSTLTIPSLCFMLLRLCSRSSARSC